MGNGLSWTHVDFLEQDMEAVEAELASGGAVRTGRSSRSGQDAAKGHNVRKSAMFLLLAEG